MTEVFSGLTGTGDATLAVPGLIDHIGVAVTTIPAGATVMSSTSPKRIMRTGWIAPCLLGFETSWPASVFCGVSQFVDWERQRFSYPAPGPYADRIRYHLEPGAVANLYVNQVVVPAVLNSALMPWDRAPAAVSLGWSGYVNGGSSPTSIGTYTVPAGRKLLVGAIYAALSRTLVATSVTNTQLMVQRGGVTLVYAIDWSNVLGNHVDGEPVGGEMVLLPGEVLDGVVSSGDTGGTHYAHIGISGFTFDA